MLKTFRLISAILSADWSIIAGDTARIESKTDSEMKTIPILTSLCIICIVWYDAVHLEL